MKIKIIFYKFDVLEIIIIFQTIVEKKNLIIQFQEFCGYHQHNARQK